MRIARPLLRYDPFEDVDKYADTMLASPRMGVFTIGGGVPRNWMQQLGPYLELTHRRGGEDVPLRGFGLQASGAIKLR